MSITDAACSQASLNNTLHHISHMECPEIELRSPRREAGNEPPHDLNSGLKPHCILLGAEICYT